MDNVEYNKLEIQAGRVEEDLNDLIANMMAYISELLDEKETLEGEVDRLESAYDVLEDDYNELQERLAELE